MAVRSVFKAKEVFPYFEEVYVELDWFGGFALSQKRKCEIGLRKNYLMKYPEEKVLEASGASLYSLGKELSAMHLHKRTKRGLTSVESAFQSSKIYKTASGVIGPFTELLFLPGKECKKKVKELSQANISYEYCFDGMTFYAPEHHISQFYDFIYLNALLEPENEAAREKLLAGGYTAFTDLATKSLNCQARSCAIFVGLMKAGKIDMVRDYNSYLALFRTRTDGSATGPESYENVQLLVKNGVRLLSPIVPCRYKEADVQAYYLENCKMLGNKKSDDNFLDKAEL